MTMGPQSIERCMLGPTPLLCVTDTSYPMVRFTVGLRQGAIVDAQGRSGLLNLMLELLLRGTDQHPRRMFHTALETLGSSLDAGVGHEQAFITGTALRRHLEHTVRLLTEAFASPAFAADELQHLVSETEQGLLRERDDDDALADHFLRQALYGEHPLGRAADGSCADLRAATLDQVRQAYGRLSAADLIIGVVGDITLEAAAALFRPLVACLDRPASAPMVPPAVLPTTGLQIVVVDKPERSQVQLRVARLALDAYHPDVDAFWLGVMAFGGTFTSPLTREVRDVRGWSYFAQADFRRRAAFKTPVVLRSAPALEDAVDCLCLKLDLYGGLARGDLAEADLSLARDYVLNRHVFDIATAYDIAGPAVSLERLGLPAARLWDLPQRLSALDLTSVGTLMARHLHPHDVVATLVAPAAAIVPQLSQALPQAQIRVVDFREGLGLNLDP
jgi:zinc protease